MVTDTHQVCPVVVRLLLDQLRGHVQGRACGGTGGWAPHSRGAPRAANKCSGSTHTNRPGAPTKEHPSRANAA